MVDDKLISKYRTIVQKVNGEVKSSNRISIDQTEHNRDRDQINNAIKKLREDEEKELHGALNPLTEGKMAKKAKVGNCAEKARLTLLEILKDAELRKMEYYICIAENNTRALSKFLKDWMPNSAGGHVFIVARPRKIETKTDSEIPLLITAASQAAFFKQDVCSDKDAIIIDTWSRDVYLASDLEPVKEVEISENTTSDSQEQQSSISVSTVSESKEIIYFANEPSTDSQDAYGARQLLTNCGVWNIEYCWDGFKYLTAPNKEERSFSEAKRTWELLPNKKNDACEFKAADDYSNYVRIKYITEHVTEGELPETEQQAVFLKYAAELAIYSLLSGDTKELTNCNLNSINKCNSIYNFELS